MTAAAQRAELRLATSAGGKRPVPVIDDIQGWESLATASRPVAVIQRHSGYPVSTMADIDER